MAIVISDTSPLRALAHLGLLDLLPTLFAEVVLPPAVAREMLQPHPSFPPVDVSKLSFFRIQHPQDQLRVQRFLQFLDAGEAEAMALAIELQADLVLLDEKRARQAAVQNGLTNTGTLGVLIQAKRLALIPAVRPLMDKLINEIRFFVSAQLYATVLRLSGE